MIVTIPLLITNILLIALLAYREYANARERKDMIRAIMAKNLTEVIETEATEQNIKNPPKGSNPEYAPLEAIDQDEFDKLIKSQLEKTK